jgi:hypothetical protein
LAQTTGSLLVFPRAKRLNLEQESELSIAVTVVTEECFQETKFTNDSPA